MTALPVRPAPGSIIGYRKDGRPIRLVAGASPDDPSNAGGTPPADPGTGAPPAPPAPPTPAPFDPSTLTPEAQAWLKGEQARIRAEEGARERTASKANAAKEAEAALLAKLGLKPDVKPEDAAAELAAERAERKALQLTYSVRDMARDAGGDHELVSAYLAAKGRLKDLDPTASDFDDKVKALIATALTEKPSLKLVTEPVITPPGGQGPAGVGASNGGAGTAPQRLGMAGAIEAAMKGRRKSQ